MIDTRNGTASLLEFLPDETLPSETLLELTGDNSKAKRSWFPSGLEKRVAAAWVIPMTDLNCAQCRMLMGQRLGLPWLARAVTTFVTRYPKAECDLYPGDLTMNAVIAWRDLASYAPEETSKMLALNFDWVRREAENEGRHGIARQAVAALDAVNRP
jgi:hypothetical protein